MDKTSVYLAPADRERLAELARREGVPQAEIIRRAIARYEPAHADRRFLLEGAFEGPGTSIADDEDRLMVGFGE